MKLDAFVAGAALSVGLLSFAARAAVTAGNFPAKTTADLVALCSAQKEDPLLTAAVNYSARVLSKGL
jgi:hypothetical protein